MYKRSKYPMYKNTIFGHLLNFFKFLCIGAITKKETSKLEKQRLINSKLVVEFCSSSWQLQIKQIENRNIIFIITRPKPAVQDGIVGPGCGSGRHILGVFSTSLFLPMALTSDIFAQMQFCHFLDISPN